MTDTNTELLARRARMDAAQLRPATSERRKLSLFGQGRRITVNSRDIGRTMVPIEEME